MQTQTVFTGYDTKSGNGKKGPWTLHLFTDKNDQVYKTFETALANELAGTRGQQVTVEYEERPSRGDYPPDKIVQKLISAGNAVNTTSGAAVSVGEDGVVKHVVTTPDDRQMQIMRQSALERAIRFYALGSTKPTPASLFALSDKFVDYFVHGAQPTPSPSAADSAGGSAEPPAAGSPDIDIPW